jgi:hypothetical protein
MSHARDAGRLPISLTTYVAWTLVTVFGMRWAGDGTRKPLIESVTHSISWNLVMDVALSAGSAASGPPINIAQGWNWTIPMLMVLPNFLFAMCLLRGVRNDTRLATD